MVDPRKPNEVTGHERAGDEDNDLNGRLMRHLREASEAPLVVSPSTRVRWGQEAFLLALAQVSQRNDSYRESWAKVEAELAEAGVAARTEPPENLETRSGIAETGAAGVRLLAGFKARLEDLIKGWAAAGQKTGPDFGNVYLAGARGQAAASRSGGTTLGSPLPDDPIVKASWAPKLQWLNLEWADTAKTDPLKESGAVDAFVEQGGERRQLSAAFRPTRDGSVDIQHVILNMTEEDAATLAGAEVEVAWLSDEEGKSHRLIILFRTNGP